MPPDDETDRDRDLGLARERTDLAWNRSGLAVAATVAIVLRRLWPLHGGREGLTLALIASGGFVWAAGMRLSRHLNRPEGTIGESGCRMLTLGTVILAVAGIVGGIL